MAQSRYSDMRLGTSSARSTKRERMVAYAVDQRRRFPMRKYVDTVKAIREKFGCSIGIAYDVLSAASHELRDEFNRNLPNVVMEIHDSYLGIYDEAMREKNWTAARRALDSLRDMFGLRSAIHVNINATPSDVDDSAFDLLSDEQLEALAKLDQVSTRAVIDVKSVEQTIDDAVSDLDDKQLDEEP